MNREVKAKWLEALRSGKYAQGYESLRQGNKFCCLGVLCEISGLPYWGLVGVLPDPVMSYAGLKKFDPEVGAYSPTGEYSALSLSSINDAGATFAEIADLIEEQL